MSRNKRKRGAVKEIQKENKSAHKKVTKFS